MTTLSLTADDDWRALAAHLPKNFARLADEHKQAWGDAVPTSKRPSPRRRPSPRTPQRERR